MCGDGWKNIGICANDLRRWCVCHAHPFSIREFVQAHFSILVHRSSMAELSHVVPSTTTPTSITALACFQAGTCNLAMASASGLCSSTTLFRQPNSDDWKEWCGEVVQGHFWTINVEHTRRQLLEKGYNCKVVVRGSSEIGSLSLPVGRGSCVFKRVYPIVIAFVNGSQKLPREVSWNGERLPALAQKVPFCLTEII